MGEKRIVDCRGLSCPQPVIETENALAGDPGPIVVVVDDEAARDNVARFARGRGATVEVQQRGSEFHIQITPAAALQGEREPEPACQSGPPGTVIFVSAETIGRGDDELGAVLMAAFLDTLAQFRERITHLVLMNGGVKLAVAGSPLLAQLQALQNIGVDILACGTCLKHFGLAEQLAAGRVSNMYEIIDVLTGAGRVLRP